MNLVLTIAVGDEYQEIGYLTHPTIRAYADRIGAEFLCIDKKAIARTTPHWEKFQIFYLLDKYDRILYVDTDVIIRDDCPNLFDIVPETHLGMFNEAPFTDRSKELMIDICKAYKTTLDEWRGMYYNSGVMVISQFHKTLFKKPDMEVFNFYEQSYLNMVIAKREIPMFDIGYKFNRMTCIDQYTGEERHASFIIHYAGYPNLETVMFLIRNDLDHWNERNGNYTYKNHIYVSVSGGMGDQLCAEPAVRFLRKSLYPDAEIVVATHYPTLFKHLVKDGVEVCKHGEANLSQDTPYYITQSLPGPDTIQWSIVSHLLCNSTDYASIALVRRTLPFENRRIVFEIDPRSHESLMHKSGIDDFSNFIVVHAGRHWKTKTFPSEWWQAIIDGLLEEGKSVCLVGQEQEGDPPFYVAGARGTVSLEPRDGVIDLRNQLSIDELALIISQAKVLVSNDSFPVHLAGAFDNWIVLIPSCKHPDHVLPYRNGSVFYKAKALYRKLIIDEVESRPTQLYPTSVDIDVQDWNQYLCEPSFIVKEIVEI